MFKFSARKVIALLAMVTLIFLVIYCTIKGVDIPNNINGIIIAFVGWIGYYFGKSTALDNPQGADSSGS